MRKDGGGETRMNALGNSSLITIMLAKDPSPRQCTLRLAITATEAN
jgi:hypothetical protein